MTRYFFDFSDGTGFARDDVGMEFESIEDARKEAAETLSEICKDAARASAGHRNVSVNVRDGEGRQHFVAKMTYDLKK